MPFATKEQYNAWKRKNYLKHREKELERKKRYHAAEAGKKVLTDSVARYRERYPEKQKARWILQAAIQRGTVKRMPCDVCGNPKSQAHHDDYDKPLEVIWLCALHHNEHHRKS